MYQWLVTKRGLDHCVAKFGDDGGNVGALPRVLLALSNVF